MNRGALFINTERPPFIFTVTVASSENIPLPLEVSGSYNFSVNYGDGVSGTLPVTAYNNANANYTYPTGGTYDITITGLCTLFKVSNDANIDTNIVEVKQWGNIGLGSLNFWGCSNMIVTATDILNTSKMTSFESLFESCSSLTTLPNSDLWDTSSITSLFQTFYLATSFNDASINSWNVSNVINFDQTFRNSPFNQSLNLWNTTKGTSMSATFRNNTGFNNDSLKDWDVSSVTTFNSMFLSSVFNGLLTNWVTTSVVNFGNFLSSSSNFDKPLNHLIIDNVTDISFMLANTKYNSSVASWNTAKVNTMRGVFSGASSFNQAVNTFDTALVTTMREMFSGCTNFNQSVSTWNTIKVTNMRGMFSGTAFNLPLSTFNTAKVTDMNLMFSSASSFNQDLSSWNTIEVKSMWGVFSDASSFNQPLSTFNVAKVTTMLNMFSNADVFNQDLSGWNTSAVTTMSGMFESAKLFNQDISNWNVEKVTNFTEFLATTFPIDTMAFSTTNYGLFLTAWSAQVLTSGVTLNIKDDGTPIKYTSTDVDSGTTDASPTANKLIETGQNFITTVSVGDIVRRTTGGVAYAEVTVIDSNIQLTLDNDIMTAGSEAYTIESSAAAKGRYSMISTDSWTITDGGPV